MKPLIETNYKVYIQWDHDTKVNEITGILRKLKAPLHTSVLNNDAFDYYRGSTSPSVTINGTRKSLVKAYAEKVLRILNRYKDITIHSGITLPKIKGTI